MTFGVFRHQISFDARLQQKLEAYHFLQFCDLQLLLVDLLIFHLQNFFQAFQILLNVFIRRQSILKNSSKCQDQPLKPVKPDFFKILFIFCYCSYHYLLVCALAESLLKSLCSVSKASILEGQRVHLILVSRQILNMFI